MSGYREALEGLRRLEVFGIRLGLDNVRAYCARAGNPERAYPTLHVAGTNGKGSTAACLAALGMRHGLKTGLYVSPHLVDFRERILVDGRPIDGAAVAAGWERVRGFANERRMTHFEATTMIALEHFATQAVDLAVLEVGLGGRLDATNVVSPLAAVVTNVARDHERHLGFDLPAIAGEKGGIFKPGAPALVGEPGPPAVRAALRAAAERAGARVRFLPDEVDCAVRRVEREGTVFDYRSKGLRVEGIAIPSAGAHFAIDAALALWAWEAAALPLEPDLARSALAGAGAPGRSEWRRIGGVLLLFDVAHNPAAIERLAGVLSQTGAARSAIVAGILADKAWIEMLDALRPVATRAWLCGLETPRPERRLGRGAGVRALSGRPWLAWADTVAAGLDAAREAVRRGEAERIVVTGSFHTVGEALVASGLARAGEPYLPQRGTTRAVDPVAARVGIP